MVPNNNLDKKEKEVQDSGGSKETKKNINQNAHKPPKAKKASDSVKSINKG